jgi:valine--pyruvate aminotransferase
MSLSKIGLPSTRTGIIIAREEIVQAITAVNAIMSLANNTLGQMITRPLIDSGEILSLSRDVVRPFYQEKSRRAQQLIHQFFEGIPYRIHESGGALFLWLWFEDGSVDTSELYQRLKARQVIIVPGKYFVYGLDEPWEHGNQCVRINFGQEDSVVEEGLKRIADEVRRMRSEA